MGENALPNVFVIESLSLEDERAERFEGQILNRILRLGEKECRYFYIRTERELRHVAAEFSSSRYRYLHLSCHANDEEIATTFDSIPFTRLGEILKPHLDERRVFLSACQMATSELAEQLLRGSGCYSVLGPAEDVDFADAALLWSSFYHLMFRTNPDKMQRKWIEAHARSAADMFQVRMNLFLRDTTRKTGIRKQAIKPRQI